MGRDAAPARRAAANVHLLEIDARRDVVAEGITAEAELELGSHVTVKARSKAGRSVYALGATFESRHGRASRC